MPKLHFIFFVISVCISNSANAFSKEIGKGYCSIRHPVEAITSDRTACESQHIIQQQASGSNAKNTIWINTTQHDYLDRSADKPWQIERPWFNWGDENLERAYMMGTYANGYHFITYNHHGEGDLTLLTWDGASHLAYVVASIANFVSKEMSYIGYQMDRGKKNLDTQYIDAVIGVGIDFIELLFGIIYGTVGIFVGTIVNPIDTLINIPGGIALSIESIIEGIANTASDVISLITLGYIEF